MEGEGEERGVGGGREEVRAKGGVWNEGGSGDRVRGVDMGKNKDMVERRMGI